MGIIIINASITENDECIEFEQINIIDSIVYLMLIIIVR